MTSCIAFSIDDLLSGHSNIHPKYVQQTRNIALQSQALSWPANELLHELISVRGKLTLDRYGTQKWPFVITNGRSLSAVSDEKAAQALIDGSTDALMTPHPMAVQSGTRLMRLLDWCIAEGIGCTFKTAFKYRSIWHHDYQYHERLQLASRLFWVGLSADLVNSIMGGINLSKNEVLVRDILRPAGRKFSVNISIEGEAFEVKHLSAANLLTCDLPLSLDPPEDGFESADQFMTALSSAIQKEAEGLLGSTQELRKELSPHDNQVFIANLRNYTAFAKHRQAVNLRYNTSRFEADITVQMVAMGAVFEIPITLRLPGEKSINSAEYEVIKQKATTHIQQNFKRLKTWAGKFDLSVLEKPMLIKLLHMTPKQMKNTFLPLKEKLHAAMLMSEVISSDPRFSHYHDLYPARHIVREWVAYLGPTNSGKTHQSMEAMASAKHAIYLSPLRLMALENQERLEEMGIPCSLVTGEEEIIREGATHYCCTVEEFARFKSKKWDVVVVDEVQMLGDGQRGWAWTDALVAANTPRLLMTGPMLIKPSLERLAALCGDVLTVKQTKRLSALNVMPEAAEMKTIPAGSIIVAFSRKNVLSIKSILDTIGRTTAVIYGALSPVVRREQARLFREGEAEILIATDAIGMGLNLPAHSVYFYSDRKFDGSTMRPLNSQEVKQIGGRAGRYGLSESGLAGAFTPEALKTVRARFKATDQDVDLKRFAVRPDFQHLSTISEIFSERSLLKNWLTFIRTVNYDRSFVAVLPGEMMEWIRQIDNNDIDMELRWIFACTPVHGGVEGYASQWLQEWLRCLHKRKPIILPAYAPQAGLKGYEDSLHLIDAYMHLARVLPEHFSQQDEALAQRESYNEKTIKALSQCKSG